ncbi:MAG: SH3 domain-containing protein, partial [Bacillaceae bacterium]
EKPVDNTYRYVVIEDGVNIRKSPTTASSILGKYQKGQVLQAKKELSNGWLQIKFNGETAYVSMDYVKKQKKAQNPLEESDIHAYNYFVDTTTLNVRMAPSITAKIIDQVYRGQQLDVTKEIYGWYEIEYEGTTAYVSVGYIRIERK